MSDETAEKAWVEYVESEGYVQFSTRTAFAAGRTSRDAEVAELRKDIANWIAYRAEAREQLAAAETTLEKLQAQLGSLGVEWCIDFSRDRSRSKFVQRLVGPWTVVPEGEKP